VKPLRWPCPLAGGGTAEEYALGFDRSRDKRLLICPALFDEANRMRRLTVEVMRRLDGAGIDSFIPDLPGTNESMQALHIQSSDDWRDAMKRAANHFSATHVLGIRGGCLFTPLTIPAWHYAPVKSASLLRQMIRARVLASREAGQEETSEALLETGARDGLELAGHRIGPDLFADLRSLEPSNDGNITQIGQDMIGGSGLWMRAEPGESRDQADALAAVLALGIAQ